MTHAEHNDCSQCGLLVTPATGALRWQHIPALHTVCMTRLERRRRPPDTTFACPFCIGATVSCYKDPAFIHHSEPNCERYLARDPLDFLREAGGVIDAQKARRAEGG